MCTVAQLAGIFEIGVCARNFCILFVFVHTCVCVCVHYRALKVFAPYQAPVALAGHAYGRNARAVFLDAVPWQLRFSARCMLRVRLALGLWAFVAQAGAGARGDIRWTGGVAADDRCAR